MTQALKVADYILAKGYKFGELINLPKLELPLYFCQCKYLLDSGDKPLFNEPLYKKYGSIHIPVLQKYFEKYEYLIEPLNLDEYVFDEHLPRAEKASIDYAFAL